MTIFGKDVQSDLSEIRKVLGVCPQHDVLWPDLTVKEHLQLYAAVKGVSRSKLDAEVAKSLKEVGMIPHLLCTRTVWLTR